MSAAEVIDLPAPFERDLASARKAHRAALEAGNKPAIAAAAWRVWEVLGQLPRNAWLTRKVGT